MPPKHQLEDDHDGTTGHSVTDRPPAKKTASMVKIKVRPETLRSLNEEADTLGTVPTAASTSESAPDSDVTQGPATDEPRVRKRIMNNWTDEKLAFLTLVYEKFRLARLENDDFVLPNNTVYDLYERFFGLDRNRKSMYMRLLRKDGSRLNHLYQELHGTGMKTPGRPLYQPEISRDELDAYVNDGYVSLQFRASRHKAFLKMESMTKVKKAKKKAVRKKVKKASRVESDVAKPTQPQAKPSAPKKATVTVTGNGMSPTPNSPNAEYYAEDIEMQEPQADSLEIRHDIEESIRPQSPTSSGTTVDVGTQTEDWTPNVPFPGTWGTGLPWDMTFHRVNYQPTSDVRNDGQMPATDRGTASDEEQAALALMELSRSTDTPRTYDEKQAALALIELSRSTDVPMTHEEEQAAFALMELYRPTGTSTASDEQQAALPSITVSRPTDSSTASDEQDAALTLDGLFTVEEYVEALDLESEALELQLQAFDRESQYEVSL